MNKRGIRTILRALDLGDEVAGEVSDSSPWLESERFPARIDLMEHSSAFCISRYTRKLRDDRPAARMISAKVEPEFSTAVAAPLRKQWEE